VPHSDSLELLVTMIFPISLQFSLLMILVVGSAIAQRNCPLGKFCSIGANCSSDSSRCVETCPTSPDRFQRGNYTTGNCESKLDVYDNVASSSVVFDNGRHIGTHCR